MRDVASGLTLAAVAIVYFWGARSLPLGGDEPGPRFFPSLLAAVLLALAVAIVVRGVRERHAVEGSMGRPVALIAWTVLYAAAFVPVGFVLSTLVYTSGVVLALGQRGWRALVIPLATTSCLYAVFTLGLGVVLP